MRNDTSSKITVMHDTKEWSTHFNGEISEILVDGKKLMQIHDLAKNVGKQNKQIRLLAIIATSMALGILIMVSSMAWWLSSHDSAIEQVFKFSNPEKPVRPELPRRRN